MRTFRFSGFDAGRRLLGMVAGAAAGLCIMLPAAAQAQAPGLAAPASVRLSPGGGLLTVAHNALVTTRDGVSEVRIVLPEGAEDWQVRIPGNTVVRWSSAPHVLERSGGASSLRDKKLNELKVLRGSLASVSARLALWAGQTESGVYNDVVQLEKRMAEAVPVLTEEKADLERRIALLEQELKKLRGGPALGQMITLVLKKSVAAFGVPVEYSYTLKDCGWRPVYIFDAQPDRGSGDETDVRLMAEVWQYSGMDWDKAKLTLVSQAEAGREPFPLRSWILEAREPALEKRSRSAAPMGPALQAEPMVVESAEMGGRQREEPAVVADVSGVYATWTLAARGLPEGHSRLLMVEDVWKARLEWLSRPSEQENRVWFVGRYTLPAGQVWPEGPAEFCMGGQSVGRGHFRPSGDEATLFYGADPRIRVNTVADKRERGESGFLKKSSTWTWGWTYEVVNGRDRAVTVRLERPLPRAVDQEISITQANQPEAQEDRKKHMLFWDVAVPAGGKAEVRHSVTVSSPKEMLLFPTAP